MESIHVDDVVVGSGPCGASISYCLSTTNRKILLIDKKSTFLGCHAVMRQNGFFISHSPTLFSTSFVNLKMMLSHFGIQFHDLFMKYKGGVLDLAYTTTLSWIEMLIVFFSFLWLLFDPNHGKDESCEQFCNRHGFSQKSKEWINSINLLTEGASMKRFTWFQFLQLFNQQSLYEISEPRLPNDHGLAKYFRQALDKNKVNIQLSTIVTDITIENNKIQSVVIKNLETNEVKKVHINNALILSIPPRSLMEFVNQHSALVQKNVFGNHHEFIKWGQEHTYKNDLSISFHFKKDLQLPFCWGLPLESCYGIVFVVVSDYMKNADSVETGCKTVINCGITICDTKSNHTHKTANECSIDEMKFETYRQLCEVYQKHSISLPPYFDYAFTHPKMYRDENNTQWLAQDTAFVDTPGYKHLPAQSPVISNLYTVGSHNGRASYYFTTIETAIQNALHFCYDQVPSLKTTFPLQQCTSWIQHISSCIIILFALIFLFGMTWLLTSSTVLLGRSESNDKNLRRHVR